MTNDWIPNPGTGVNPMREGERLVALRFADGSVYRNLNLARSRDWTHEASSPITHFKVSPPRTAAPIAEPATMSADKVLIRAREAAIEAEGWQDADHKTIRAGDFDDLTSIQAIIAYERDRAKSLVEVAPHTAEDPDERAAYEASIAQGLYNLGSRPSFEAWRETVLGKAMTATFRAGKAAR